MVGGLIVHIIDSSPLCYAAARLLAFSYRSQGYRRRSGWTSGGTHGERRRWVRAEWGGVWEGCPLSSRLRGLGERRELPQRGRPPAENGLWRILKATERLFLYLYDKICGGGDNLH